MEDTLKHLGTEMRSNFKQINVKLDQHKEIFQVFINSTFAPIKVQ
jgi:hypothetical protein